MSTRFSTQLLWKRYLITASYPLCASKKAVKTPFTAAKLKSKIPRVAVWNHMTLKQLSEVTQKPLDDVLEATIGLVREELYENPEDPVQVNDIPLILKKLGFRGDIGPPPHALSAGATIDSLKSTKDAKPQPAAPPEKLKPRRPVVTVMGHVDHGKTTLLDTLRKTRVVDQEFGGITQHIGTFTVKVPQCAQGAVTFLDTPGHAAFSAMRARGANVTDMVILVVAADDGVMEQTVESIRYANNADVPIIVAINKMDKPTADPEKVKQGLLAYGLQSEDSGGETQFVNISAKTGDGIQNLLEAIAMQSEILDLRAPYEGLAEGFVIERTTDDHRGKLCTIIVTRGQIQKGSYLVAGEAWCKVRSLTDERNQSVTTVVPGEAAQITGWKGLPSAGDLVLQLESEKRAKEVVSVRERISTTKKSLDDLQSIEKRRAAERQEYREKLLDKWSQGIRWKARRTGNREKEYVPDGHPELCIVIKGDTNGSVEAVVDIINAYDREDECRLEIIHEGVGPVTASDIQNAETFDGIVYALHVDVSPEARALTTEVPIKKFRVIYHLIDDIKEQLSLRMPLVENEELIGEGEILQEFLINVKKRKVPVAGSRCTSGEFKKSETFRVERDGKAIFEGSITSMRHLKNEVSSIKTGVECGLMFDDPELKLERGDLIFCVRKFDAPQQTSWKPHGFQ